MNDKKTDGESRKQQQPSSGHGGEKSILLQKKGYVTIVLNDGQRLDCKILDYLRYMIYVDCDLGKLAIPKGNVKYYIIEDYNEGGEN